MQYAAAACKEIQKEAHTFLQKLQKLTANW